MISCVFVNNKNNNNNTHYKVFGLKKKKKELKEMHWDVTHTGLSDPQNQQLHISNQDLTSGSGTGSP
jgi:hypothetical protein